MPFCREIYTKTKTNQNKDSIKRRKGEGESPFYEFSNDGFPYIAISPTIILTTYKSDK